MEEETCCLYFAECRFVMQFFYILYVTAYTFTAIIYHANINFALLRLLLYGLFFSVVLIFIYVKGMYGAPYGIFAFFTIPNFIYFK